VTIVTVGAQGLSAPISYLLALVTLVALFLVLWLVCDVKEYAPPAGAADQTPLRRRRVWYLFLGADDRVSTSKVQFALWTLVLAWALLVIAFHDAVYPPDTVDPRYLLLLGFPAGAAAGAKAITVGQISAGILKKPPAGGKKKTPQSAVADIVSTDQGDLDLGDAQYFLFNLVALVTFFVAFFNDPTRLPVLPATLVALTSVSAAAYVAKKAVPPTAVKVTAVSPQRGPAETLVRVFGTGFGATGSNVAGPAVTFDGFTADPPRQPVTPTDTTAVVCVPKGLDPGTVDVQVVTADGRTSILPAAFTVTEPVPPPATEPA
jgi:hypothetical protein